MANICSSQYCFYSRNAQSLSAFRKSLISVTRFNDDYHTYDLGWMGYMVEEYIPEKSEDIRYRGNVEDIGEIFSISSELIGFNVWAESAWVPVIKMWDLVLKKCFPDISFSCIGEELGCGVFVKYDKINYYCDRYILDVFDEGIDYFSELKSIICILKEKYNISVADSADVDQINSQLKCEDGESFALVTEVEIIEDGDFACF